MYRPMVLTVCRRELLDDPLAEDATQEAVLQAFLRLAELRRPDRFAAWLAGIGRNVSRSWMRKRGRERPLLHVIDGGQIDPSGQDDDPLHLVHQSELASLVRRVVEDLPDGQRAAVSLFYLDGCSYAEAAGLLGIGPGAVRTRLFKAREVLRRDLKTLYSEEYQMTEEKRNYRCLFCDRTNDEVVRMIAGRNNAAICDECVDHARKLIADETAKEAS